MTTKPSTGSILILSGPIGSGKTTVARELIALLSSPVAYIEGDRFWSFFAKSQGGPTHQSFVTIMVSMTAAAVPFASSGSRVVLDFSMPPWFLPTAKRVAAVRDIPIDYVVLRPSMDICADRAATRIEGRIADYARHRDLYASFDDVERHTLSDGDASAAETAASIVAGLNEGWFRLP